MSPGPAEEAGQTARTVVDAMKGSPLILFLLIFILVFLGLFAWATNNTRLHYEGIYKDMLDNQAKLLERVGKCGTP
jgi:hypothetical protein